MKRLIIFLVIVVSVFGRADAQQVWDRFESAKKLKNLGLALYSYANDCNQDPNSLRDIKSYIDNNQEFQWIIDNVEFLGMAPPSADTANTVIAYDKTLLQKNKGTSVLFADGHVEIRYQQELKQLGIIPETRAASLSDPNIYPQRDTAQLSEPNVPGRETTSEPNTITKVLPSDAIEITVYPAQDLPVLKYRLVPNHKDLIEEDAAPLYYKGARLLTDDLDIDTITEWLDTPLSQMPLEEVRSTLQKLEPISELLSRAALCRTCNWQELEENTLQTEFFGRLKNLTKIIALKARLEIARRRYAQAAETMRTGLVMARHIASDQTIVHGLVGIASASIILKQTEQFVQTPSAPSLFRSLQDLGQPLIDLNKTNRVGGLSNKLDRLVAALQCVEAIRFYGAAHEGQYPESLNDITEIRVPKDPVTNRPFYYYRTDGKAVLQSPPVPGRAPKHPIYYELTFKQ